MKSAREQLERGWRLHRKDDIAVFHHGVGQTSNRFQFFGGNPASQKSEVPKIRRAALEYWIFGADRHAAWAMPTWLYWGLVQGSQLYERKGSRFVLHDQWNWTIRQSAERRPPASIRESWRAGSTPSFEVSEASSWIAFFRDGPGARKKSWKGVLQTYAGHVQAAVRAEEKKVAKKAPPANRSQEVDHLTAERASWEAKRDAIARKAFAATFADWSDADFDALDKAFLAFLLDD